MKNIFIEFRWSAPGFPEKTEEYRYYVSGPIMALNTFHRDVQRKKIMKDDRKTVLRPKLTPDQYKILRCFESYSDGAGNMIESEFSLPKSNNPVEQGSYSPASLQDAFGFS